MVVSGGVSVFLGLDPYLLALGDLRFGGSVLTLGRGFGRPAGRPVSLVRMRCDPPWVVSDSLLGNLRSSGLPSGFHV